MDPSKATGASVLPIARVKRIIKLDEEITTIGTDSTFLIAIAAELFVDYFVKKGVDQVKSERRKTIRYEDMANLVKENENLEFLQDIVPQSQTFEDYLENRNQRKKKRKARVIDEDGREENIDDEEDSENENSDEENGTNSSDLEDSQSNEGISDIDTINEHNSDVSGDSDDNNSDKEAENDSEVENGINSQEENSDSETSMNGENSRNDHRKRNGKNVAINNGVLSDSELSDAPETSSDNSTVLNDEN
ncbi:hypothetical protein C1645_875853 [Glomus cerebriforme]|uniref:Transcription factor CBF/NF-Y/archaeal histone domain-containing protein n=1 Tax=Glomus cerebriforme TaxID=658196 RepID=A0A397T729_9GLOM|nr:hypothetical protein C1645_875853 [Glomus cerebriforme]